MKLAYFEANSSDEAQVRITLPELEIFSSPNPLEEESLPEHADTVDILAVFVDSRVSKAVLDSFPNVKLIVTRSTGYDHIDMDVCGQRNIVVCNVPSYGENTVAEHAFALILALSRKIFQSYERTEKMQFNRDGLEGFDLNGKTLGVVGCGAIGRRIIQIGKGFSMQVVAFDVHADLDFAKQVGFSFVDSLDALLQQSDVITLNVPYLPHTHHLVNMETVKRIKPGAILINTARGGLVDTKALLWALENNILSGVGLDVLEDEEEAFNYESLASTNFSETKDMATLLRNRILVDRDNVLITPHNAFNSREAKQRILNTTLENIQAFISGKPQNVV